MRKALALFSLLFLCSIGMYANDYDKAWEALRKNNRTEACKFLEKAFTDPTNGTDAYLTYLLIKSFEGNYYRDDFEKIIVEGEAIPAPYVYALWFKESVLGDYGKKERKSQLTLVNDIINGKVRNGSLEAAAHYVLALHYFYGNDFKKSAAEYNKVGAISDWQFTGPFDNISGSGFYKEFGPLEHPEASAVFQSRSNANVSWFHPAAINQEAWIFPKPHFLENTAVLYAQSFVYSAQDQDVWMNLGGNGTLQLWVNDGAVLEAPIARSTELDYYRNKAHLHKGYNRILMKIGYAGINPNFIVRITDEQGQTIPGLNISAETQPYKKAGAGSGSTSEKHFAEAFFERKIKEDPKNLINYLLLSQTYLRNQKTFEARTLIMKALDREPDNSLLRYEYMQCLLKDNSRTLLMQEVERIKESDPDCILVQNINLNKSIEDEKYEEALEQINKMEAAQGETEESRRKRIEILAKLDRSDEMMRRINEGYKKYPNSETYVRMMYSLKKNNYKDNSGALKVYEKFLDDNFNFSVWKELGEEYIEMGQKSKGLEIMKQITEKFPYEADYLVDLARYYYTQQDYKKALDYAEQSVKLAPYVAAYWGNIGTVQEQIGNKQSAIDAYKKAIYYNSKLFDEREKLRQLEKKSKVYDYFEPLDIYALIKADKPNEDELEESYYYVINDKRVVLYGEGASEEYNTFAVRVLNEKGIDQWKENYIPYNEYSQTLLVEKAELVKANGSKLPAEQSGNEFVFTNLEKGDVLYFQYKIRNFQTGRLANEFFDKCYFKSFVPEHRISYAMLIDNKRKLNYEMMRSDLKPEISKKDEFTLYSWVKKNVPKIEDEPYMPELSDVGEVLHVSTIPEWKTLSDWYADLSTIKAEDEFEVREAYTNIFGDRPDKSLTDMEKAQKIYTYISNNIRYSSVSFRQSAYVPQKPSVTLNTRLGDCKDLSNLFMTLGKMAGLNVHLLLVETRDNGIQDMVLPSLEFNHCIALLKSDGKEHYIELTDNNLPFGNLPVSLWNATALYIPWKGESAPEKPLRQIPLGNQLPEQMTRKIKISTEANDLKVHLDVKLTGDLTSGTRDGYAKLSEKDRLKNMEESIGGWYKNPIKMSKLSFTGLDSLSNEAGYSCDYRISNELISVGNMRMFKLPFTDAIATIDNFSLDERQFPIEYFYYENTDQYETEMEIEIPEGQQLVEVPTDEVIKFKKSTYEIHYTKLSDRKLKVVRKAKLQREMISPQEYADFKTFLNKIIAAESKYVAFK